MKTAFNVLCALFVGIFHRQAIAADQVAVVGSGDNSRVEIFYARTGSSPGIYHTYQPSPGLTVPFGPWEQMSIISQDPASIVAQRDRDGRIVIGWLNGGFITVSQGSGPGSALSSPVELSLNTQPIAARRLKSLAVAMNEDGRSEFFAIGQRLNVFSIAQKTAGLWDSLNIHDLGGRGIIRIAATPYRDGRLALIALGPNGSVSWRSQTGPNNNWGPWVGLGGSQLREIVASKNSDGTLQIVALGGDGKLWQLRQNADWSWPNWGLLVAGPFTGPLAIAKTHDERLEVFAPQSGGGFAHFWENLDGTWNPVGLKGDLYYSGEQFSVATMPTGNVVLAMTESANCHPIVASQQELRGPLQGQFEASWTLLPLIPALCPPTVQITALTASPNPVAIGGSSTLGWNVKANLSCLNVDLRMMAGATQVFDQPLSGSFWSFAVTPTSTTTYRLTATCVGTPVSDTRTVALNVTPATTPGSCVGTPSSDLVALTPSPSTTNVAYSLYWPGLATTANLMKITNKTPVAISMVAGGYTADTGCFNSGTSVTLQANQATTDADLTKLYGSSHPALSLEFLACVFAGGSQPNVVTIVAETCTPNP